MTVPRELCSMKDYIAIGVMSGSSLDGIDLARCKFRLDRGRWTYSIENARTVDYDKAMRERLRDAMEGSALDLARLNRDLGELIGSACKEMIGAAPVDLIASHGHTIFHKPDERLSTQIGCGARIAAITSTTTVCDFRTKDVALGGQGAPLVPLGEKLLFPEYSAFLNIGGICNISLHFDKILGYDICIANQALNHLAEEVGSAYDKDGATARSGFINTELLDKLSSLPLLSKLPPRSIGREWFNEEVRPLLDNKDIPLADRMHTVVVHIAKEIDLHTAGANGLPMLVTGGGAHNSFLMDELSARAENTIVVPDKLTVDYKEALIFAFLGVLRLRNEPTALASVTGAEHHSVGGAVYSAN